MRNPSYAALIVGGGGGFVVSLMNLAPIPSIALLFVIVLAFIIGRAVSGAYDKEQ